MLAVMGLLDHKAAVEAEKVSLFGNTVRAGDNAAIIFQDPLKCLNPTVKIGRQIAETVRNRKKCTPLHAGRTKNSEAQASKSGHVFRVSIYW